MNQIPLRTSTDLNKLLDSIDRKSYPSYKETKGRYQFGSYILNIDHVQGDPFASPSSLSIWIEGEKSCFPKHLYQKDCIRIAIQDELIRMFEKKIGEYQYKAKGSGKSGQLFVSRCGQEVLERATCTIQKQTGNICIHLDAGFPANGRTINSKELVKMLFDFLPDCVQSVFFYSRLDADRMCRIAQLTEDQEYIRQLLPVMGLKAFIANGSVLPRKSGVSSLPMKNAVPFISPPSLEITLQLPHKGEITGMGIPEGITLIVGGGYHGKSTLLKALEIGVYDHILGDGREYVITVANAAKIRSEDGRCIKNTDISMFINDLPNKKDTRSFCTEDASGSTSQAANVMEAVEAGTSLFLIDEDTSATNFMIRDELMQRVVSRNQEPITPFIERVHYLYDAFGISSVIVAGSSGAYFHIADHIIQMDQYIPRDITLLAREAAKEFPGVTSPRDPQDLPSFHRILKPLKEFSADSCFSDKRKKQFGEELRVKIKTTGTDTLQINKAIIDLRYLEQLIDQEQTAALGYLLKYAHTHLNDGKRTLTEVIDELFSFIAKNGLAQIAQSSYLPCGLAMPRRQEVFSCFNRYRL